MHVLAEDMQWLPLASTHVLPTTIGILMRLRQVRLTFRHTSQHVGGIMHFHGPCVLVKLRQAFMDPDRSQIVGNNVR